jgi:hypothetical protein
LGGRQAKAMRIAGSSWTAPQRQLTDDNSSTLTRLHRSNRISTFLSLGFRDPVNGEKPTVNPNNPTHPR